jgi:hypothetical protein
MNDYKKMEKIPKIAVLLLGNLRSYNITFKNLEAHLLQPYNCDVYVTTYNKRFNSKHSNNTKEEPITESHVRNVYGKFVKKVTVVDQDRFIEPYCRINNKQYTFNNDLERLYTIQKLGMIALDVFRGECFRNKLNYDIIIKMRPDVLLLERFNINTQISDNQIMIPANDSGGHFNDHIAYGRNRVMSKYLSYYKYFREVDNFDDGKGCDVSIVEAGLRKHLEMSKMEIIRIQLKYTLLRDIKPQRIVYAGKNKYFVKKY